MDLRKIKKLIELVEESGIAELEVKSGDEAVRIARPIVGVAGMAGMAMGSPVVAPAVVQAGPQSTGEPAGAPATSHANGAVAPVDTAATVEVRAPMAGTFYVANEPGAEPFVQPGAQVAVGDVVCIIESMKMMNEIRSENSGRLVELVVTNAEPVASGQLLMRLR